MSYISSLKSFFIKDELIIVMGDGGFPIIQVNNKSARASISVYGAQVLSYTPKLKSKDEERDVLFLSKLAHFESSKAIKGGIPVCWPWFGKDPENLGRQMHGFARNILWQLEETVSKNDGETKVVLSLTESEDTVNLWPYEFKVIMTITIGKTLALSLQTVNSGKTAFTITQALHTYFSISDISMIQVNGLDQVQYIDTVNGQMINKQQEGGIIVNQEVDRIYTDAPQSTSLQDNKLNSEIQINTNGSNTTVVWNPWVEISKKSADLEDDAYQRFICIETANAAKDVIEVKPSQSHTIETEYSLIQPS